MPARSPGQIRLWSVSCPTSYVRCFHDTVSSAVFRRVQRPVGCFQNLLRGPAVLRKMGDPDTDRDLDRLQPDHKAVVRDALAELVGLDLQSGRLRARQETDELLPAEARDQVGFVQPF